MSNPSESGGKKIAIGSVPTSNKIADAPFDDEHADVILRSSDEVDFHVFRVILLLASPFFHAMFELPQKESSDIPEIPMTEDSKTLRTVLEYCYPGAEPVFQDLEHVKSVMEAMSMYDMGGVAQRARRNLLDFVEKEPLRVFAIACRYKWEDGAKVAATQLLDESILPLIDLDLVELESIPAGVYRRLLVYHQRCGAAAIKLLEEPRWMDVSWIWFTCMSCAQHEMPMVLSDGQAHWTRKWFVEFLQAVKAVLKERPSGKSIFDTPLITQPIMQQTIRCGNCNPVAAFDLTKFVNKSFIPELHRTISEIDLDLKL